MKSYAIIGTGAIGGFFAAKLKNAGFDVHCLMRSDYTEVKKDGLKLISNEGNLSVPVHSYQNMNEVPPCDVVLVTLKTTSNHLLSEIKNILRKDTIVVILQNGIGVEEELANSIDPEIIVGGSCNIKVTKISPGVVLHDGFNKVDLACLYQSPSLKEKLDELVSDFNRAGINAAASPHLPTVKWLKLIHNIPLSGLPVVYDGSVQEVIEHHYDEIISLTKELIDAAKQCGANIPDDSLTTRIKALELIKKMPETYSSMKVDFDNHRSLELQAIYENPIRIARQHHASMPLTEVLYQKLQKMNRDNLKSEVKAIMQSGLFKPAPTNPESVNSGSLTALLVMIAYKLSLENNEHCSVGEGEKALVNYMIDSAISAEPAFAKWRDFLKSPAASQQEYFNTNIFSGFASHKLARKSMIKSKIEDAIEHGGVEQVIFLSGGYDHQSYMLANKYDNAHFFELDRGITRKIKIDAIRKLEKDTQQESDYVCFNDNLHLIECDFLKQDLREVLMRHHFDPQKRTLFVAEGLTMYLTPEHNRELLNRLFQLLKDGEEVLISYRASKQNPTAVGDQILASSNEPFQFSINPQDLPVYAANSGFDVAGKMLCSDLLDWVQDHQLNPRGDSYFLIRRNSTLHEKIQNTIVDINDVPLIAERAFGSMRNNYGCN